MQWAAMFTMLIDHIGIIFFPDEILLRIIGRIAFPLYALGIAIGYERTRNRKKYMIRLGVIAAAAQIPYMIALDTYRLNVVATFMICLWTLSAFNRFKRKSERTLTVILVAVLLDLLNFEYGSYALLLILMYRRYDGHRLVMAHMLLNLFYLFYLGWIVQLASILPTLFIAYRSQLLDRRRKIPVWLWRSFYPAHLAALAIYQILAYSG